MNLRDLLHYENGYDCHLCFLASNGIKGVVWPIDRQFSNMSGVDVWLLYIDVQEPREINGRRIRSVKRQFDVCADHHRVMWQDWCYIMDHEVREYDTWQHWLERKERAQELHGS